MGDTYFSGFYCTLIFSLWLCHCQDVFPFSLIRLTSCSCSWDTNSVGCISDLGLSHLCIYPPLHLRAWSKGMVFSSTCWGTYFVSCERSPVSPQAWCAAPVFPAERGWRWYCHRELQGAELVPSAKTSEGMLAGWNKYFLFFKCPSMSLSVVGFIWIGQTAPQLKLPLLSTDMAGS